MKKNTKWIVLALSVNMFLQPIASIYPIPASDVFAEEQPIATNSLYQYMIQHTPMTDTMWQQLPTIDKKKYEQEFLNGFLNHTKLFHAMITQHPEIFAIEANRIRSTIKNELGLFAPQLDELSDEDLLWAEYYIYLQNGQEDLFELALQYGAILRSNTFDEAAQIARNGFADEYRNVLLQQGISEQTLAKLPEDALFTAAVDYKTKMATGGDPTTLLHHFKQFHPELFTVERSLRAMTFEEATQHADNGFANTYRNILQHYGITDDILKRLPENAVHNAAVTYQMRFITGGDPGVMLHHFKTLYPEAFIPDIKPLSEHERQVKMDKLIQNQKMILQHIQLNHTNATYLTFKPRLKLKFEHREYEIEQVFYLPVSTPEDTETFIGIRYTDTSSPTQPNQQPNEDLLSHTVMSQQLDEHRLLLHPQLSPTQTVVNTDENSVPSFKNRRKGTLYYKLLNPNDNIIWSIIQDNTVTELKFNLQDLMKLPPQSGLFTSDNMNAPTYLFDNDVLYLLYPKGTNMADWQNSPHVTINVAPETLSSKAHKLYQLSNADTDMIIVKIDELTHEVHGERIVSTLKESSTPLFTFISTDDWATFETANGEHYTKVNIE